MSTQWRVSMNGATGLDYNALSMIPAIRKMDDERYADTFECLRVMEKAALKHMRSEK